LGIFLQAFDWALNSLGQGDGIGIRDFRPRNLHSAKATVPALNVNVLSRLTRRSRDDKTLENSDGTLPKSKTRKQDGSCNEKAKCSHGSHWGMRCRNLAMRGSVRDCRATQGWRSVVPPLGSHRH